MKLLYFFLFLWVIYALLDPDPATQITADRYGSGSETLLSDVKNCTVQAIFLLKLLNSFDCVHALTVKYRY